MSSGADTHEDASAALARHVANVSCDSLPAPAIDATKRLILNTIAITLAGHAAEGSARAVGFARSISSVDQATILGSGYAVAAPFAAFANATLANAHDFDDNFDPSPVHTGPTLVPTALAIAELRPPISGAAVIAAIAAGVDVICRLASARSDMALRRQKWHSTSVFGYFGCAAVAAKLLGLPAAGIQTALALGYSMTSGTKQCIYDGAPKANQMGNAAQAGVLAALMADSGLQGAERIFEGAGGFFPVYIGDDYDSSVLLADLNERHFVTELSLKPYPGCRFTHAYIDAAVELRDRSMVSPAEVDRIIAVTSPADRHIWEPIVSKVSPPALIDAQFSGYYAIANAFTHGTPTVGHYTSHAIADAKILELARRVEHREREPTGRPGMPSVAVELHVGERSLRAEVDVPRGAPENPLDFDQVAGKLRSCSTHAAVPVCDEHVEGAIEAVASLEEQSDVAAIPRALVGGLT